MNLTEKQIKFLNSIVNGQLAISDNTGLVNVIGDVKMRMDSVGELKTKDNYIVNGELPVSFGEVTGDFNCSCMGLVTLKGSPYYVGGYFDCSFNQLTSLKHAPVYVEGGCDFLSNPLLTEINLKPDELCECWCLNIECIDERHYSKIIPEIDELISNGFKLYYTYASDYYLIRDAYYDKKLAEIL